MQSLEAQRSNRPDGPSRAFQFALVLMLFLFAFTHRGIQGQNDLSRFVAIDSLINRGTWQIDESPYVQETVVRDGKRYRVMNDMVKHPNGHFYSSKPPVLTLIGAGVLKVFQLAGGEFQFDRLHDSIPTFMLTWLLVGGLSAGAFYVFRKKAGEWIEDDWEADIVTLLALGATIFLSYSTTLNNHTVAASLVLISLLSIGLAEAKDSVSGTHGAIGGFLMGLALVIDMPAGGAFGLAAGLYILFHQRSWKTLVLFGLGSLPPIALHCAIQYSIWGSVLPVQLMGEGYGHYAGSYWNQPLGPDSWDVPRYKYWLLTLFSTHGIFLTGPVLLVGVAGVAGDILGLRRKDAADDDSARGRRVAALAVAFAILLMIGYYGFFGPTNFGGSCFSFRWYIGFVPVLAFYALRCYARRRDSERFRKIFHVLGLVSLMYALIGMQAPWHLMELNGHPAVRFLMLFRGF